MYSWNRAQLWQTMKLLGESPSGDHSYDHILFNVFKGDDVTLRSLARADILRVVKGNPGQTDRIRAGSPVYLEAFKRFLADPKLRPGTHSSLWPACLPPHAALHCCCSPVDSVW
jgi:hypothetical protein